MRLSGGILYIVVQGRSCIQGSFKEPGVPYKSDVHDDDTHCECVNIEANKVSC